MFICLELSPFAVKVMFWSCVNHSDFPPPQKKKKKYQILVMARTVKRQASNKRRIQINAGLHSQIWNKRRGRLFKVPAFI